MKFSRSSAACGSRGDKQNRRKLISDVLKLSIKPEIRPHIQPDFYGQMPEKWYTINKKMRLSDVFNYKNRAFLLFSINRSREKF